MSEALDVRGKRALIATQVDDEISVNAAVALATHGCRIVLVGDADLLRVKSRKIIECNSSIRSQDIACVDFHPQSCTQQSVDSAVAQASSLWGGLDILLISSSYTGELTSFLDTSGQQLEDALNLNFKQACMISIAVGQRMKETGSGGSIIFITSIIGTERGLFPGVAVTGASIAALNYLTRAMAMELGKYKIRVNAVARGFCQSDALLKHLSTDVVNKEGERIVPLRRWVQQEKDLAAMILYLAGDSSSFITGTVIFVDGGQSLVRPRMRSFL